MTVADGCRYAFIVNRKAFECPYFVECCRRTKIELKHIRFYEPNVVYVPKKLEPLIYVVKKVQDEDNRTIALDAVCQDIRNNKQEKDSYLVCYQQKVVETVIHNRLHSKQSNIVTRLQCDNIIKVFNC